MLSQIISSLIVPSDLLWVLMLYLPIAEVRIFYPIVSVRNRLVRKILKKLMVVNKVTFKEEASNLKSNNLSFSTFSFVDIASRPSYLPHIQAQPNT